MADPSEPQETGDVDAILGELLSPARTGPALVGQAPALVRSWFADALTEDIPIYDGTLSSARLSADADASRAKSRNTRRAYVSDVRAWCAWCAWCDRHTLPSLGSACGPRSRRPACVGGRAAG